MRLLSSALVLAAATCLAAPASADIVHLRDGRSLEGRVRIQGGVIEVFTEHGSTRIDRADALRIERVPTRRDIFLARLGQVNRDDPDALERLAHWCKGKHLVRESQDLLREARDLRHEKQLRALRKHLATSLRELEGTKEPQEYVALAQWARGNGLRDEVAAILQRALALEPDFLPARVELGQRRFDGRWLPAAEARRLQLIREAEQMQARGFVRYDGRWMTLEARAIAIERDTLARERRRLASERDAVESERCRAAAALRELQSEASRLAALRQEIQSERQALVEERERCTSALAEARCLRATLQGEARWIADLTERLSCLERRLRRVAEEVRKHSDRK